MRLYIRWVCFLFGHAWCYEEERFDRDYERNRRYKYCVRCGKEKPMPVEMF